jgi:hypothetical protein
VAYISTYYIKQQPAQRSAASSVPSNMTAGLHTNQFVQHSHLALRHVSSV